MVHTYNPSTWEAEAELRVQGQPKLHSKTLSRKQTENPVKNY
jgi:hypothetical protein